MSAQCADPWEQRKFGEVFEEYSDKGHPEQPALTIIQGGGTVPRSESDRQLQYDKSNLSSYKLVNMGDFILHLRSFEGGLELATRTGIVSPAYHIFHGKETDSIFYYSFFRSPSFIDKELSRHVYGIRDGRSVDVSGMKTIQIPRPSIEEQREISAFIGKFDSLITLHQRKLEHLREMKRGLLQKMFPRDGESVPELRFPGFTDPWEQRKFGDMYRRAVEKNDGSFDRHQVISVANMYYSPVENQLSDGYLNTYNIMLPGDIAFEGHASKQYAHGRFVENTIGPGIVSHVFEVFRPTSPYDITYWKYAINNECVMRKTLARATKASTMMHSLVAKDFLAEAVRVPSLREQARIGEFFASLDSLITLHQRKELASVVNCLQIGGGPINPNRTAP